MKRIPLFEFEDQKWLPSFIRAAITRLIVVFHRAMGTLPILNALIDKARQHAPFDQVVEMGAGAGGATLAIAEQRHLSGDSLAFLLSDLYPDAAVVQHINAQKRPNLSYHPDALNATQLAQAPAGLKMMVNSFHHTSPGVARQILASAQAERQPFLVYEIGVNNVPTIAWWLFLPLSLLITGAMALVFTPQVRPLTARQLLFTYLIPVIPIVYAWDGQASLMRMYTYDDVRQHLLPPAIDGYHWEVGPAPKVGGKTVGYYIMGYPTA